MKLRIIICLLTLMQVVICIAQTDFRKIAPSNPNVASLMKAALTPVTEYVDTANVGVPLYNINVENVNLPISLDYHTGGIQVAEESGVVGLGRTLNAGGVITRNKMGHREDLQFLQEARLGPRKVRNIEHYGKITRLFSIKSDNR